MFESKQVLIAVGATVVITMMVASIISNKARKKRREVLESFLQKTAPVAAAEELANADSSTCECRLDGRQMIITSDAQVANYIFNGRAKDNYDRRPAADEGLRSLGMYQRGLIWNNELSIWRKVRGCFRMSLNDSALRRAAVIAKEECRGLLQDSIGSKREVALNLLKLSRRVTFRVTLNVFFGIPSSRFAMLDIDEEAFIEAIVAYFKAWEYFLLRPISKRDDIIAKGHRRAVAELNIHVQRLLNATLTLESTKDAENPIQKDRLFVNRLRVACQLEKDSNDLFQQSALEMLLAGTDTSSVTAYYALLGMAGDIDLQEELRNETSIIVPEGTIQKNALLESVINETLRFKPVGPVVLREAVNADPNFPGMPIESKAAVLVHLAAMNRREEYWQDPHTFHPERFMTEDCKGNDKIFFPFGEGPKGCIGMHLGRREVGAILETVVSHYDMSIQGDVTLESLETHWDIANQPDNPPLILVSRRTGVEW